MYFVFDIGGTKTRMAISREGTGLAEEKIVSTPENFEEAMTQMGEIIAEYNKVEPISAAAGGIAGELDGKKNKLMASPNLPGWIDKPVGETLKKLLGTKTILDNDAAMGGLGEARIGAGRRRSIVGFLTIGTGIGGSKIVDGEIEARAYGFEPGHQIIAYGDEVKYWEEFASGTAMAKMYGKPAEEIEDPQAWDMEAQLLAIGINNVTVLWSPEMIVLGGSVMKKVDIEKIKAYLKKQIIMYPKIPEIVLGELGDRAGLMGALVRLGGRE